MMNKKEANVLMKEYLDKLLQKQMINQSTYDKAVKKFAAGGVVVDPLAVIQQAEKTPQVSTPIMTPQEQALLDKKIETAKTNSVVQAAKTAEEPSILQKAKELAMQSPAVRNIVEEKIPAAKAAGTELLKEAPGAVVKTLGRVIPGGQLVSSAVDTINELGSEQLAKEQGIDPSESKVPSTVSVLADKQGMQRAADRPLPINPALQLKEETSEQFDFLENAVREGARLGSQQAAAESVYLNQMTKNLEIVQREQALKQEEIAKVRQEMEQKISELSMKATEAAQIDPQRWWNSRTTGQKILAAIGLALGGSGSAEIINNYINQDIEAQKAAAAGKARAVNDVSNLYQQNLAALKDELAATLATRETMLGIAELKLKSLAAQTNNRQVQINAQIQLGELQLKKVQVQRELQQQIATQAFLAGGDQSGNAAIMARLPKEMRELIVTTADGQIIPAKTPDAQKKLSELESSIPNLLNTVRRLKEKIGPNLNPYSKAGQEAIALRNGLLTEIKQAEQLGALDQGLVEFADKLIPDPTGLNPIKTKAAYETLEKRFKRNLETARSVYGMGYRPINTVEPNK
jgi:hypothetical protein